MTSPDPAAAELERKLAYYKERGEREVAAARDVVTRHSGENILALVAAVEAVLKDHGDEPPAPGWYAAGRYCPACTRLASKHAGHHVFVSPADCTVREAITSALTGKEASE